MPKIQINAPRPGISQGAHIGFADVRQLDLDTEIGVAIMNKIMEKKSSTTVDAQIKWIVRDPVTTDNVYSIDSNGQVYKYVVSTGVVSELGGNTFTVTIASPGVFSETAHGFVENDTVVFSTTSALPTGLTAGTTYYIIAAGLTADAFEVSTSLGGAAVNTSGSQSGTHSVRATTNANGNGLEIWKDYLFVARNTKIDVYGLLSGTPTWTFNWAGLTLDTDSIWHPMLHSKLNDRLYIGAGKYLASVIEETTFAPGTAASYTATARNLSTIPSGFKIKCLEELGNNLMIGTWKGTNVYDIREATIFPWDMSSSTYGQPLILNEYGVHALLTVGGSMFILAGTSGSVYRTEGGYAYKVAQLPVDLSNGRYFEYYPGAIASFKDKIYFGIGNTALNVSGGAALTGGMGVYSLQTTGKGSVIALEHLNSANTDGTVASVKASAILPITSQTLMMAWRSNTTYGIDVSSATSYVYGNDYSAYFESPLYEVGRKENKFKPKSIELHLGQPLRTGEGIRLAYRTDVTGDFTATGNIIKTMAYADNEVGAMTSRTLTIGIPDDIKECEQLQFRVSLKGTSTTSPEFKTMIIE